MPKKSNKSKYTDEDVLQAVASVENGSSFRSASAEFGVPVMTISNKYSKGHLG